MQYLIDAYPPDLPHYGKRKKKKKPIQRITMTLCEACFASGNQLGIHRRLHLSLYAQPLLAISIHAFSVSDVHLFIIVRRLVAHMALYMQWCCINNLHRYLAHQQGPHGCSVHQDCKWPSHDVAIYTACTRLGRMILHMTGMAASACRTGSLQHFHTECCCRHRTAE